jgi:hypothetical protein
MEEEKEVLGPATLEECLDLQHLYQKKNLKL